MRVRREGGFVVNESEATELFVVQTQYNIGHVPSLFCGGFSCTARQTCDTSEDGFTFCVPCWWAFICSHLQGTVDCMYFTKNRAGMFLHSWGIHPEYGDHICQKISFATIIMHCDTQHNWEFGYLFGSQISWKHSINALWIYCVLESTGQCQQEEDCPNFVLRESLTTVRKKWRGKHKLNDLHCWMNCWSDDCILYTSRIAKLHGGAGNMNSEHHSHNLRWRVHLRIQKLSNIIAMRSLISFSVLLLTHIRIFSTIFNIWILHPNTIHSSVLHSCMQGIFV